MYWVPLKLWHYLFLSAGLDELWITTSTNISAQTRDLSTSSAHRIPFAVEGSSQFNMKWPRSRPCRFLPSLGWRQCSLFSFAVWVLSRACQGPAVLLGALLSWALFWGLVFQFLFQHAGSSVLIFVSASQEHWEWPLFCLLLGGGRLSSIISENLILCMFIIV